MEYEKKINEFEFDLTENAEDEVSVDEYGNVTTKKYSTPYSDLRKLVKRELRRVSESIAEKVAEGNIRAKAEAEAYHRQAAERDALVKASEEARIAENDRKLRQKELEEKRLKQHLEELEKAERAKLFAKFEKKWVEEEERIFSIAQKERLFIELARKDTLDEDDASGNAAIEIFSSKYTNPYQNLMSYRSIVEDEALKRLEEKKANQYKTWNKD